MSENDGEVRKKFYAKIFAVQAAAVAVGKTGRNTMQKYDYTKSEDVVFAARKLFIENRLTVVFSVLSEETIKIDRVDQNGVVKGSAFMCKLHLTAQVMDIDTGFDQNYVFYGSGYDTTDKGAYKAATGAIKYGYLSLMNIPTGDDPEKDSKKSDGATTAMEGHKNEPLAHVRAEQAAEPPMGVICTKISAMEGDNYGGEPATVNNARKKHLGTIELKDAPRDKLMAYGKHLQEKIHAKSK